MILDGNKVAKKLLDQLKQKEKPLGEFIVVQVGRDKVSNLYVEKKREMAAWLGVDFKLKNFDESISQENLILEIEKLNNDKKIRGILVQIPLPSHIDRAKIASAIEIKKDVDGFAYILRSNGECFLPPTVLAIDAILDFYKIEKQGKKIEIVGGGFLVGQPLFRLWHENGLNVEILKKDSLNYKSRIKAADIVVVATGGGANFDASDFKSGATVIDASTMAENGKIRGDVNSEGWPEDKNLAPVPGGVGPVTVAMLYKNFYNIGR